MSTEQKIAKLQARVTVLESKVANLDVRLTDLEATINKRFEDLEYLIRSTQDVRALTNGQRDIVSH